jgi:hypothetical protein
VKQDSSLLPNELLQIAPTQEMAMIEDMRVINNILNGKKVSLGEGNLSQN